MINETAQQTASHPAVNYLSKLFLPGDSVLFAVQTPGKGMEQRLVSRDEAVSEETIQQLNKQNAEGKNIYVCMSAIKRRENGTIGRTKEDLAAVRAVYLDFDDDGKKNLDNLLADTIFGELPAPDFILNTSPGKFQVVWLTAGMDKDTQELLNKALRQEYHADPAATDCVRVLRVPGFANCKYESRPMVTMQENRSGPRYKLEDFKIDLTAAKAEIKAPATVTGDPIPYGKHDAELTRIGGNLRRAGAEEDSIRSALIEVCEKRCEGYGSDYREMCAKIAHSICRYPVGKDTSVLVRGQVAGEPPVQQVAADWRTLFRAVKELEDGEVKMLISNFLVEGLVFIGGLPGEGKTLLALSMVKALTTGRNFLGRSDFTVPQQVPVLYMIPESGARAFRKRCEKFGIPSDRDKFVCRTISEGATLRLDNPNLIEAVAAMKPVVFLDTVIRFSHANDENAAAQNKKLVDDIIALRQAGAVAIVGLHHATKAMRQNGIHLENVLRGTGDLAAACDGVYGLMRDDLLYDHGNGPLEIDIECVKPRDFEPPLPFRVRATRKVSYDENTSTTLGVGGRGIVSVIDESGDLQITASMSERKREADEVADRELDQLMTEKPEITLDDLAVEINQPKTTLSRTLRRLGWQKQKGQGHHTWTKTSDSATR